MRANWLKKVSVLSLSCLYALSTSVAVADDTEIFFNTAYKASTKPNVLFIIDTSGSMGDKPSSGGSLSKLQIVKNSMTQLLSEVSDVNVGLARYTVPGGPILHSVAFVDDPADPFVTTRVSASADDAEQATSGSVSINNSDLDIMEEAGGAQWVGIRFASVDVPQGAKIKAAALSVEASATSSGTVSVRIYGEKVVNAPAFSATTNDISGRAQTSASIVWSPVNFTTVGDQYTSTEIASIIEEIVAQPTWCGGNSIVLMMKREGSGTNLRSAYSYDGDASQAPVLRVQYDGNDFATGASKCLTKTVTAKVGAELDDVEENWSGTMSTSSSSLDLRTATDRAIGLRFPNVQVPKDADVIDAKLEFTANTNSTATSTTVKVQGVAADNFTGYATTSKALTTFATPTSASQNVTFTGWVNGQTTPVHPESIHAIIKEITSRTNWATGNALGLIVTYQSGDRKHAKNYASSNGPRLNIRYKTTYDSSAYTVRQELQRQTNELRANGYTPISDTLLEGGLYYRGGNVLYGKTRQSNANNMVSHPDTYTGGTPSVLSGCDPVLDPYNAACKNETITGTPVYKSPITDSCQKNHIVFLTDGLPTWNAATTASTYASWPGAGTCIAGTGQAGETQTGKNGDDCTIKIAQYLHTKDQSGLPATQTVTSHFIGFDVEAPFLKTAAEAGGGGYYKADDATMVLDAFRQIINNVLQANGTFVSAGVTTSQSNRLRHDDQLYFSVFGPTLKPRWPGNVKRYKLSGNKLVDVNGNDAVNTSNDQFSDTAQSWWSPTVDGNQPGEGGVASQLTSDRKIYSNISGSTNVTLISTANAIADSNTAITATELGAGTAAERTALLNWAKGVDIDDLDANGNSTEANGLFTDPLHSRPTLLRYKSGSSPEFLRVFVGTNSGFLSSVDPEDGSEKWAFMPRELLAHLKPLRDNIEGVTKPYGMDGSIVPYFTDTNKDGVVNVGSEEAFLVVGMRRGGDKYYVIDVSDPSAPKLKFVMGKDSPVAGNYERIGQTWSAPVIAKIKWGGVDKLVMIFGGGYDISQDPSSNVSGLPVDDGIGNLVYIADAESGEELWSSDALSLTTMTNSIPADVAAIDLNSDGLVDHLYATDMRAQVFRFDLKTDGTITGDRLAHLQTAADKANNRRFYAPVDVAYVQRAGEDYVAVAVGSGYREGPLNIDINDHFYMIRDFGVAKNEIDEDVTLDRLVDITDLVGDVDGDGDNLDALEAIDKDNKLGWYYDFSEAGEKVLSPATILNGVVYFGTYLPPDDSGGQVDCSGGTGSSRLYAVSLTDGNPIKDTDGNGIDGDDRFVDLANCATCGFVPLQIMVGEKDLVGLLGQTVLTGEGAGLINYGLEKVKRVKWRADTNNGN